MKVTMMSEAQSVAEFRAASAACQEDLLRVMQKHVAALGGPMGGKDTLIEFLGSYLKAVLEACPMAQPPIHQRLIELALYVSSTGSTPQ
jgi:hypothetical protein